MNDDLKELLQLLKSHGVEFLIIGAHAVAFYGRPRFTEDLDLYVNRKKDNCDRLLNALNEFSISVGMEGVQKFSELDRQMIVIGRPPHRVDLHNFAGDSPFETVWEHKVAGKLQDIDVWFASKADIIKMKQEAGRAKDLADIELLKEA